MDSRKEIQSEIDLTIELLVENEQMLETISLDIHYDIERSALQKTQESLLARLIHLQTFLEENKTQNFLSKNIVRTPSYRLRRQRRKKSAILH